MNKGLLWMAVTADELELPVAVADTAKELSSMLGLTGNGVLANICRGRKNARGGLRYVRVEVGSDD